MNISATVFEQVIIMFLLMAIGFFAAKIKMISLPSNLQFTDFLLYFVTPAVVIESFFTEFNINTAVNLGIAFGLGFVSHLIAILLSYITVFKKNNPTATIQRFAMIYSNCGFMALPLVNAVFGNEGVLYASAYMVVFQILAWTHGYITMSSVKDKNSIIKSLCSPVIISVVIGLIIFFARIPIPGVISKTVGFVADLNTPLAMIVIGVSLSAIKLSDAFKSAKVYYTVFLRNILVPLICVLIYSLIDFIPDKIILINIISTACPCASLLMMFSGKFNLDTETAGSILTLSNIASVFSIPAIMFLAEFMIK